MHKAVAGGCREREQTESEQPQITLEIEAKLLSQSFWKRFEQPFGRTANMA